MKRPNYLEVNRFASKLIGIDTFYKSVTKTSHWSALYDTLTLFYWSTVVYYRRGLSRLQPSSAWETKAFFSNIHIALFIRTSANAIIQVMLGVQHCPAKM